MGAVSDARNSATGGGATTNPALTVVGSDVAPFTVVITSIVEVPRCAVAATFRGTSTTFTTPEGNGDVEEHVASAEEQLNGSVVVKESQSAEIPLGSESEKETDPTVELFPVGVIVTTAVVVPGARVEAGENESRVDTAFVSLGRCSIGNEVEAELGVPEIEEVTFALREPLAVCSPEGDVVVNCNGDVIENGSSAD